MAVVIRMKRTGRRHRACYRISVADSRKPRDGRTIENLGVYDPQSPVEGLRLTLDVERAKHWVEKGALPSETVYTLFKERGVYEGVEEPKKRDRSGRKNKTARQGRRREVKSQRLAAKTARREEREKAKAAAKAAAAAAGSEE